MVLFIFQESETLARTRPKLLTSIRILTVHKNSTELVWKEQKQNDVDWDGISRVYLGVETEFFIYTCAGSKWREGGKILVAFNSQTVAHLKSFPSSARIQCKFNAILPSLP